MDTRRMRTGAWRATLAMATVLAALTVGATDRAAAVDVAQGRLTFGPRQRVLDTRDGPGNINDLRVTERAIPAGLMAVTITSPLTAGRAALHPCGSPLDPTAATFLFDIDQTFTTTAVVEPDTCLTSTTPLHVIVDHVGDILPTPFGPGPLQYVPVDAPAIVLDDVVGAGDRTLPLPATPSDAAGAVFAVTAVGNPGYLILHPCGTGLPLLADVDVDTYGSDSVAVTQLAAPGATSTCLYSFADAFVQIALIGYLRTSGPDPTRLPPTSGYRFGDVPAPGIVPAAPVRVLDTREGLGAPEGKAPGGESLVLDLNDQLDTGTTSVVLNVTVTEPDAAGFVTAYPCDGDLPTASNVNYERNQTVPNLVTVPVAANGTVCLYTKATTHLIADLTGTLAYGGDAVTPVTPSRLLDTREGNGAPAAPLAAGDVLTLQVAGRGGVPAVDASAVTLNVTATDPLNDGFLTVYPCDADRPTASNVNYRAGQTVPNAVTVALSVDGTVCIYAHTRTEVIADVSAWFGSDGDAGFKALAPTRVLDTRVGIGDAPYGVATVARIAGGRHATVNLHDRFGVPADATAVVLNVTVTNPAAAGFVTVYPCDADRPTASNLNFVAGQTVANQVTVAVSTDASLTTPGDVCLYTHAAADLVVDVAGYYTTAPDQGWRVVLV